MSDFARPSQSDFVRALQRLHERQRTATTEGERLIADTALADFLRANSRGRAREWFDSRRAAAGDRD